MTCMEAEKMVVPYMKDELSPTELEDFLDHIKTCENCREELEIHYMVDAGIRSSRSDGVMPHRPTSRAARSPARP